MAPSQRRAARSSFFRRFPAVATGLRTGILFSLVLTVWLFLANRVPALDRVQVVRNAAALAVGVLIAFEPVARFRNSARNLAVAGGIGWAIGSLCYFAWTLYFLRLASLMGAFHLFVLGAAVYGLIAVIFWLAAVVRTLHHHRLAESKLHHRAP